MPLKRIRTIRTSPSFLSAEQSSPILSNSSRPMFSHSTTLSNNPHSRITSHTIDCRPTDQRNTLAHARPLTCTTPLAPLTPPPIIHAKSPYCRIPLPPQVDTNTAVSINPVLEFTPRPLINFDLSLPSSSITTSECHGCYLFEPATYPNLPSLSVISPLLPWAITVHASSINPAFVTVADVLGTIYSAVHISVTEAEYLASPPRALMQHGPHRDQEYRARGVYQRDMIRLDFFGGKNRFLGLSESSMGWDTWVLKVQ